VYTITKNDADSRLRLPAMPQRPGEAAPDKQLTGNVNRRRNTLIYSEPDTYTRRLCASTIAHLIFLFHTTIVDKTYTDTQKRTEQDQTTGNGTQK